MKPVLICKLLNELNEKLAMNKKELRYMIVSYISEKHI